jgi:hypothetical protein
VLFNRQTLAEPVVFCVIMEVLLFSSCYQYYYIIAIVQTRLAKQLQAKQKGVNEKNFELENLVADKEDCQSKECGEGNSSSRK